MNAWVGAPVPDDASYKQALQRRMELAEELRLVNEFISLYEKLFRGRPDASALPASEPERPRQRQRNVMSPRQLANLAQEIIIEGGRPMTRSELVDAIEARGVPLAGADRVKNLGTILWRSGQFENLEGRGYWPRGAGPAPEPDSPA